ncbi:MAG TPA: thioredoxin family protein, partial [Candidatus Acidoferrales bacterium]|nr:thioredoxin family protein [Candidatus Acidoferrales bacterium]
MKTFYLSALAGVMLCLQPATFAQTSPRVHAKKASEGVPSFAFEPLDNWKAAVLAGDRASLMNFYSTNPAARAKTPQGDRLDPGEEPDFWSSLKPQGLKKFTVLVLEQKSLQPGIMTLVIRTEADFQTSAGEKSAIIGGTQVWAQKLGDWKIIATQRNDPSEKQVRTLPEPLKSNTQLYPPPEEAQPEISSALSAAAKQHKRVILVFGGNWCYDCHVLDTTFHSKAFAPIVNANYIVVHVNVGNYDVNLDLAKKYEIPLNKGVPSLAILDPDGTLLVSQKNGEFESTV